MKVKLGILAPGTVFSLHGQTFKKSGGCWGNPRKGHPDWTEAIDGKPSSQVAPKLGGEFQEKMKAWMPDETLVNVYYD